MQIVQIEFIRGPAFMVHKSMYPCTTNRGYMYEARYFMHQLIIIKSIIKMQINRVMEIRQKKKEICRRVN